MNELIVMVGNIGSGKSTVAKILAQDAGYICVSLDSIRYGIGCGKYRFDPELEPLVFKSGWFMLEQFTDWGYDVIVDETNMSKKLRKKFIALAKNKGYKTRAVVMPKLPMGESVKRRMNSNHGNTNKETWEMVWKKFDTRYEVPTADEGFDAVEHYKEPAR